MKRHAAPSEPGLHLPPGGRRLVVEPQEPDLSAFVDPFDDRRLLAYFEDLRKWHGYIRFLGLPHLGDDPDVPIERLYVEPELSVRQIQADRAGGNDEKRQPVLEALAASPRAVVLGDPGSGKSTLVSWLTWQLSRFRDGAAASHLGPLVPVPMILRELKLDRKTTWESLLAELLERPVARHLNLQTLEPLLASGQALLMLDGLDEIGSVAVRKALAAAVQEGMDRHKRCRFLLTSRVVEYEQVPFHSYQQQLRGKSFEDARFEEEQAEVVLADLRYVAPFSDSQIERFARNWYGRYESVESEAEEKAARLVEAVRANGGTLKLARIPNLLTLIALIHRIRSRLPHGRALLYEKIAEAYLESIDEFRGVREVDYTLAEKRRWLAYVGFQMQRRRSQPPPAEGKKKRQVEEAEREVLVQEEQLRRWIREAMEASRRTGETEEETDAAAQAFISYIARRSGLLLPRGEGLFAFTHLSFQEFFAAVYLEECIRAPRWPKTASAARGDRPEDLRAYGNEAVWRESLILLFELLAERPGWPEAMAETLFGEDFKVLLEDQSSESAGLARLLAEVSIDPHAGLPAETLREAWVACWTWELRAQSRQGEQLWEHDPTLPRVMLTAEHEELQQIWLAFEKVVQENPPSGLTFRGCDALTDVDALKNLVKLQALDLDGTRIENVDALKNLVKLQTLHLGGTRIENVDALKNLVKLQTLYLGGTRIENVDALKNLVKLQTLYLDGTRIENVDALKNLVKLQNLYLGGTRIENVDALKNLKNLKIYR